MTIYRVKYRKLGFFFDLLSFIAFIAILGTAALYIFQHQPLLYIIYSLATFIALKTISKSILAVKISIDTSSMHDPTSGNSGRKSRKQQAAARPAQEPSLRLADNEADIPVLDEFIAEPEPADDYNDSSMSNEEQILLQQKKRLQELKRLDELKRLEESKRLEQLKLQQEQKRLKEQELLQAQEQQRKQEEKRLREQAKKKALEKKQAEKLEQARLKEKEQARVKESGKKPLTFHCDFLEVVDTGSLPEDYADICLIDTNNLVLGTPDFDGEITAFETVKREHIQKITYEELRNLEKKKFRLFSWLAAGVISGLLICLTLTILTYNRTGHLPREAWLVTTMLPVMALATFGGIFTGILIPHKKTKIFILYTIHRKPGGKIRFVTGYKGFKRARRAFSESQLVFEEAE